MSWDLYLVPPEHAEDPGEWMESLVLEDALADRAAAREHARVVKERRPDLEEFGPAEDGAMTLSTNPESGLPFELLLDGRHAGIGVAYWDVGDRTEALADLVEDVVAALTEATGWIAFDPQDDRLLGSDEVRAAFISGHADGVTIVDEVIAEEAGERRPSWLRRFLGRD